jgi:hypothetical protein
MSTFNIDLYFRSNSVYALGRLIKTSEIDELIKNIRSIKPKHDQYYLLYYLGKGLIERGKVLRGIDLCHLNIKEIMMKKSLVRYCIGWKND